MDNGYEPAATASELALGPRLLASVDLPARSASQEAKPRQSSVVCSAKVVGATATLFKRECAARIRHSLEGVPEDLPRLGGSLSGIARRVELERPDPSLQAQIGRITPSTVHF